jgi:hypothetical protein
LDNLPLRCTSEYSYCKVVTADYCPWEWVSNANPTLCSATFSQSFDDLIPCTTSSRYLLNSGWSSGDIREGGLRVQP